MLRERGIASLYSHQALTADTVRAGRDVVVATPTASGKTLCYSLPILEKCLQDPDSRALMLFPLKALAQDQLAAFGELTGIGPKRRGRPSPSMTAIRRSFPAQDPQEPAQCPDYQPRNAASGDFALP